ncbi:MAG: ABC transporter permease [Anaerolineae bacterium]|nr:ABC transporter permease [Candidatus Roseilinea sp.]MDW8449846.1 ABC transporter permease [Anaerolineae bacterium]
MATATASVEATTARPIALAKPEGQWTIVLRRFRRHRLAIISLMFIIVVFIASLITPLIAPFPRDAVNPVMRFSPPMTTDTETGKLHVLGTDHVGRDTFTRLLYAARITLSVAIIVATLSTFIGMAVGALAGYYRGVIDGILMRILEFMSAIPTFPILLILASVLNQDPKLLPFPDFLVNFVSAIMLIDPQKESRSVLVVIFVITLFGWTGAARLMRGMVLSVRERDFIESARSLGANNLRIITRHVVPNAFPPLIVAYTLALADGLTAEVALSFLGLGITDPTPTWGNMLNFSTQFMLTHPWAPLIPGIPVVLCSLAFNFIGDGLRDALDPRLKM